MGLKPYRITIPINEGRFRKRKGTKISSGNQTENDARIQFSTAAQRDLRQRVKHQNSVGLVTGLIILILVVGFVVVIIGKVYWYWW